MLVLSSTCIIHFGVVDVSTILYYRGGIEPLHYKLVDGFDLKFRNNSPPPEIDVCTCKSFANQKSNSYLDTNVAQQVRKFAL